MRVVGLHEDTVQEIRPALLVLQARWLLFGVSVVDPVTFLIAVGALATVAMAASYIPARRVTRADPMAALRNESQTGSAALSVLTQETANTSTLRAFSMVFASKRLNRL